MPSRGKNRENTFSCIVSKKIYAGLLYRLRREKHISRRWKAFSCFVSILFGLLTCGSISTGCRKAMEAIQTWCWAQ